MFCECFKFKVGGFLVRGKGQWRVGVECRRFML